MKSELSFRSLRIYSTHNVFYSDREYKYPFICTLFMVHKLAVNFLKDVIDSFVVILLEAEGQIVLELGLNIKDS